MGHLPGHLHREEEALRDFPHQRRHHVRRGDAVVGGVDLHGIEPAGIVGKPGLLGKIPGIDRPHPVREGVARCADPYLRHRYRLPLTAPASYP